MNASRLRGRYLRILVFFGGVILRFILWELFLARVGLRQLARRTRSERFRREAVRFRALAIRMGGVMIKVGQFLSSRLDVLPPEITDELSGLQDEVPAESFEAIRISAKKELGGALVEQFEWFDQAPLAAASLGQVHRARLKPDAPEAEAFTNVVVKILRPYIEQVVDVDLSALKIVGRWLMRYRPIREHADVPALLREFSETLREEIDYQLEAQSAETFFENFKDDPLVHVPRVVRSKSTQRVLTLEDVFAIKITDYDAITAAGIDRAEVAKKLLDTYLQQIFEDGFFHADPHPGNLFVTPQDDHWQLTFVDFGMVGHVSEDLRAGLKEMVIALGTKDSARLIKSYKRIGFLLPGADTVALEEASRIVFDRFWGLSMKDIRGVRPSEFRDIGHRVRDVMLEMPFQVPNDLLMLVRSVSILSGMCTGLDPEFNLWEQLSPYARKLIEQESGTGIQAILDQVGAVVQALIALPSQTSRAFAQIESGGLTVQSPQVTRQIHSLTGAVDRLTASVIFAALVIGAILLYNAENIVFGEILFGVALIDLFVLMFFMGRKRN